MIILDMNAMCPLYPIMKVMGKNELPSWWNVIKCTTPKNLIHLFETTGFQVLEIRTLNFVPHATGGFFFEFLKTLNPVINAIPVLNKLAMTGYIRGLKFAD